MRKSFLLIVGMVLLLVISFGIIGCSDDDDEENEDMLGTLKFTANGEDFVRQGFVSKDGWRIDFDHVYITISDIAAYQTNPPYDAHEGGAISGSTKINRHGRSCA